MQDSRYPVFFTLCTLLILAGSFLLARDRLTWIPEGFPILAGLPILFFTYRNFPLTNLAYGLLLLHFAILAVGKIYTHAQVPLDFWMQDWFHFSRNHYTGSGTSPRNSSQRH